MASCNGDLTSEKRRSTAPTSTILKWMLEENKPFSLIGVDIVILRDEVAFLGDALWLMWKECVVERLPRRAGGEVNSHHKRGDLGAKKLIPVDQANYP